MDVGGLPLITGWVSAPGGGYLPLVLGGVLRGGGVYPSMQWADTPPPRQNS